jgi:phage gp46-like protein
MSAKLENWQDMRELVLMSVGTDRGTWWADPGFGSGLWLLQQKGKADGGTADEIKRMIREALQWLVTDGLADKINVEAERQGKNAIAYRVTVFRGDTAIGAVEEVWNAV